MATADASTSKPRSPIPAPAPLNRTHVPPKRESRVTSLRAAIDEVALAARADPPGDAGPEELAERLAGLWAMMAELDPDLAARLRGYYPDTR